MFKSINLFISAVNGLKALQRLALSCRGANIFVTAWRVAHMNLKTTQEFGIKYLQ